MWHLSRPSAARVAQFLDEQRALPLTYAAVGAANAGAAPAGFALDHNRQVLGRGAAVFAQACVDLRSWRMIPAWTEIEAAGEAVEAAGKAVETAARPAPIEDGQVIAVIVHALGVWWLNAARIVYVIDEPRRFGFAYGTLPGHVERGEERFLVEWLDDDRIWYDVRAISRPRYWAARLAHPVTRALQRRFARDSKAAMAAASAVSAASTAAGSA